MGQHEKGDGVGVVVVEGCAKGQGIWGYRRENGRVGVRNHVIILPVDDLSNAAAEAVAHNIKGAMAIPHPYGRHQFGADLDLHFRTLIGTGCNPNVAAVVVIGIGGWTQRSSTASPPPASRWWVSASRGMAIHETIARPPWRKKFCRTRANCTASNAQSAISGFHQSAANPTPPSGCGANPTVGNAFDKLYPLKTTLFVR